MSENRKALLIAFFIQLSGVILSEMFEFDFLLYPGQLLGIFFMGFGATINYEWVFYLTYFWGFLFYFCVAMLIGKILKNKCYSQNKM